MSLANYSMEMSSEACHLFAGMVVGVSYLWVNAPFCKGVGKILWRKFSVWCIGKYSCYKTGQFCNVSKNGEKGGQK